MNDFLTIVNSEQLSDMVNETSSLKRQVKDLTELVWKFELEVAELRSVASAVSDYLVNKNDDKLIILESKLRSLGQHYEENNSGI